MYSGVPHHRVEAIVEAKSEKKGGGRQQAATYAYRHHQARPDRPGFYLLVIKPQWYQVLYSDPTGVFASPHIPWDNTDLLVAYVYSHYNPPDAHFLWDETVRWFEHNGRCTFPSWKIQVNGEWYTRGRFIFVGESWSRLTTTFGARNAHDQDVIIKDSYHKAGRRFKEEEILEHLHAEGDLLGVVRLHAHETLDRFVLKGPAAERSRVRFVLLDSGSEFETAKTVNDLLKAVYDALEGASRNFALEDLPAVDLLLSTSHQTSSAERPSPRYESLQRPHVSRLGKHDGATRSRGLSTHGARHTIWGEPVSSRNDSASRAVLTFR